MEHLSNQPPEDVPRRQRERPTFWKSLFIMPLSFYLKLAASFLFLIYLSFLVYLTTFYPNLKEPLEFLTDKSWCRPLGWGLMIMFLALIFVSPYLEISVESEQPLFSWPRFPWERFRWHQGTPKVIQLEKPQWLNLALSQAWPYMTTYLEQQLRDKVIKKITDHYDVTLTKVDLGDSAPQLIGIKCYDPVPETKGTIVFDVDVLYESNCENVQIEKFGFHAGLKNASLRGLLRLELNQLSTYPEPPFAGMATAYFYTDPQVDYDFADIAIFLQILDIVDPDVIRNKIREEIAKEVVYPNRFVVPLHPAVKSTVGSMLGQFNSTSSDDDSFELIL